ncbi:MAG: peptidylprolyl isomerase [Rhodanobacteraceae bacterium]
MFLITIVALPGTLRAAKPAAAAKPRTMQEVLATSTAADWRQPDPANTMYLQLAGGRVVIELAPAFAPLHVANIKALVRAHYFDGLSINRVQDNFVTQWGDPHAGEAGRQRSLGKAKSKLPPEFTRSMRDLPFTRLPDGDVYAPQVGFSGGLPVARDPVHGVAWLAHCYGMVGVGRDNAADSGSGAEMYVVIGHAPRQLDRNIALVGRVLDGVELLSALPRGPAPMGMYVDPTRRVTIESVRMAADVPEAQRSKLDVLRTNTPAFAALVESRRNRSDAWYLHPAGKIDLCNVPLPVRVSPSH